jgi:hypothetical protein
MPIDYLKKKDAFRAKILYHFESVYFSGSVWEKICVQFLLQQFYCVAATCS